MLKNHLRILLIFSLYLFLTNNAKADWEATLKNTFDIVDTFDNLQDWDPPKTTNSNYYSSANMPKKLNGTNSIWTFYSTWAPTLGTKMGPWISDFGQGNSVTGKSLVIDNGNAKGPSRFGTYFGDGTASSGYSDIYIFYRVKYPKNIWPTSLTNNVGTFVDGQPYTWVGYWKTNTLNMGCTGPNANTQCPGTEPYGIYHLVPHINAYSYNPRGLYYMIQPTGGASDTSLQLTAPGYQVQTETWSGVEFHYKNYVVDGLEKTDADVWIYDADGTAHQAMTKQTFDYTDLAIDSSEKWNFFFLGGNASYSWDSSIKSEYLVDDFIIDDQRIGISYFSLLNGSTDNVGLIAPSNLSVF